MSELDSLNEFYVQENMQLLEQLEEILLAGQSDTGELEKQQIEEIFRAMHTIKGASAMMGYDSLTKLTHSVEDVFDEIRNGRVLSPNKWEEVIDVVLDSIDFLKEEISNVAQGLLPEASIDELHERAVKLLSKNEEVVDEDVPNQSNIVEEVVSHREENSASNETINSCTEKIVECESLTDERYCFTKVFFDAGCAMEGIRALGVTTAIDGMCSIVKTIPEDLMAECDDEIINNGFTVYLKAQGDTADIEKAISETMFLKSMEFKDVTDTEELKNIFGVESNVTNKEESIDKIIEEAEVLEAEELESEELIEKVTQEIVDGEEGLLTRGEKVDINIESNEVTNKSDEIKVEKKIESKSESKLGNKEHAGQSKATNKNSFLTVNINKIDKLMNLVGEIVTTESMVEKQSQMANFDRDNFDKQARRLHQLTNELQDVVMSIRMVPISSTFTKMQRVVRDMSKKTGKLVDLVLIGEQTEVDKNILENISDPLMHMIRNSMDHGVEMPEERRANSKPEKATVTLEAKNTGGDVVIIIKDDGKGLNKEAIVKKAIEKGVTNKSIDEITDKEAYNFILAPGFSTKEAVTEYSGRGVGMDVVYTNIRKLRGSISIDSEQGKGTMFVLRIPLTLAIVDGMKVKIGDEIFIIPALNIKEVFRQGAFKIVENPNGEEHSIIRGKCYKICRISNILGIDNKKTDDGIMILVESEMGNVCAIVDGIIGQQQVVVKPIPTLLTQFEKVHSYLSGCSILEDGSISLIFDVNAIINR